MDLIRLLTANSQQNQSIYNLIEEFFILLKAKYWIKNYIFWELELFKVLGYDLEFENIVERKMIGNQFQYISKSTKEKKIIPNFLVEKNDKLEDLSTLLSGLKLLGDYLDKTILRPNNLSHPISRSQFISTLR